MRVDLRWKHFALSPSSQSKPHEQRRDPSHPHPQVMLTLSAWHGQSLELHLISLSSGRSSSEMIQAASVLGQDKSSDNTCWFLGLHTCPQPGMVTQRIQCSPLGRDASAYQWLLPDWFLLRLRVRSKWPKTIWIHRLVSFPLKHYLCPSPTGISACN